MKRVLLFSLCVAFSFSSLAQTINPEMPLPNEQSIRKGVLENGMTYYIYDTKVTKGVASYYIIQNVGSVLENDNQQGLAHFLEHMAFNGTRDFPGKGILNKMQEHGLVFGKDINAYTSFDETVYNINNIPTTPELIETGLSILQNWSNYLSLTDEEIDSERGVVKEEWRTRQSGGMRILQQTIGTMFNNSIYSKRLPIGQMEVVEGFKYKALRDFYHDWYRTDLQAIAIIGDVNVDEIEQKIKELFSTIPAVKNPIERKQVRILDNEELIYDIAMDKEVTSSNISFGIRHDKSLKNETVADLKESLLNGMVTSIISTRLNEINQKPESPLLYGGVNYGSLSRLNNEFSARIVPKPNMQHEAFELVISEINRAAKFGFTKAEIATIVAQYTGSYENQIAGLGNRSHGQIVRDIQTNYLENTHITDIAKELEIAKIIFSQLTQQELLTQIQKLYLKKNRSIVVTGVAGNKNLTKEEALTILNKVENDQSLKGYVEEENTRSLMSGVDLITGSIVSEKENKEIGSTIFILSNGIQVHYKFADKNKNDVNLSAVSYGGQSLLKVEDIPSTMLLGNVIQMSGLGEFSAIDLPKVLAGKKANSTASVGSIDETVSGSSSTKDVETMMQLVNLRFTKPRFDETSYNVLMQQVEAFLIRKSEQIQSKMQDSVTTILYGKNHPTERLFDKKLMSEMSFNKMKSIYTSRFGNAGDFTFFIVGDVTKETIKPLLEKYIASIPTTTEKENWKDNSTSWINNKIDKDVFLEMKDPKTSVRVVIKNDMKYSLKNSILMRAMGDVLQLGYTESLREEEGGTYGASSRGSISRRPTEEASISINFDCNPDLAEKLIGIVHKEIEAIKNGVIQQVDLDKTLTNYLKEREESKNYNRYQMSLLMNSVLEGYNMNDPKNYENIVKSITDKDLQNIAKKLMKNSKSYEIVFKPEN
ncbi:M16 family metallopeptidase [Polaribacter glomeratus]|uniref:Peptidase M16 n=1 Tax=Polaribacter glomeratus TaxID=102 RepID=A0A2S7WYZ3_9FLAO|nr:M16 family metallopeptidase [Polaribacter glomeratus]PQJ82775.1 peptidase M16 [Polaribacter glomeratus]TXD65318.1 insulinase family protein [Polaribacter glomeratus]